LIIYLVVRLTMIKANVPSPIADALSTDGLISRTFSDFEQRPEQIKMACAVSKAFEESRHLAIEAGTGIGKSFAYLIPAIDAVNKGKGRVLISTYTITLQEQLINKDLPFLANSLGIDFTAVLAKGRSNYICLRRLTYAGKMQKGYFDGFAQNLNSIKKWAQRTKDGSLSDLGYIPAAATWDAVKSEHGNCRGRKCSHFRQCFYFRARRRLESADIIVANHALMFSDLVLKQKGTSFLPPYKYVIIDEAHNMEHVAEGHFGINLSSRRIEYMISGLFNSRTHKGLLVHIKADKAIDLTANVKAESKKFFKKVRNWYEESLLQGNGKCEKEFVEDTLSQHLKKLRAELVKLTRSSKDDDEKFEIMRFADRCADIAADLKNFLEQQKDDYIYWVEVTGKARRTVSLKSAAINVGPDVKSALFDRYESVIMTSATLSCDNQSEAEGFNFFAGRIGLEDFDAVKLGSPFDYEKQVTVYIEKNMAEPNKPDFIEQATEAIKKYVNKTQGRAFVLFTSYSMMSKVADNMEGWFAENNIDLLLHGSGIDRSELLHQFKADHSSVLFGTDSFWQGVDVPGEALGNVIIVKLPFAVPSQPLIAGRIDQIKSQGGNPFFDYQLPLAIIKFKQGFGRLIRNKNDRGIVVILDSRIIQKRYGVRFLNAIPKCTVEVL